MKITKEIVKKVLNGEDINLPEKVIVFIHEYFDVPPDQITEIEEDTYEAIINILNDPEQLKEILDISNSK